MVLRTYDSYIQANMMMGRLKEAGIHAFLQDEYVTTLAYVGASIKLVVPDDEARTASAMLGIMEDEAEENFPEGE